jgi:hypothetical protein
MKFTQIPATAFQELQLNAGILLSDFTPSTGTVNASDLLGATSGGVNFTATPTYQDFGADVDNCPPNTKELKKLDSWDAKMSGTFVTLNTTRAKALIGAADIGSTDTTKITPRTDLALTDFADIWWVGDYSEKNGATNGGFVAIRLINALSTGGFKLQSANKAKGQFAFEFKGHYASATPTVVPFEVYIKAGTAEA